MPFPRHAQGLRPQLGPLPFGLRRTFNASTTSYASHSNRQKKLQAMREFQARVQSDPYGAVFGKQSKPFWRCITPDFLKQETGQQGPTETSADRPQGRHYAQASSFRMRTSQKAGSKPVTQASSASWNSETNEVRRSVYDPISGRMVPANNSQSRQASGSTKGTSSQDIPIKSYEKPTILSKLPKDDSELLNTPTSRASFDENYKDKIFKSEHEELLATRRHLEALREQVQILERRAHPTLTKSNDISDAERPAVFEDGWDSSPTGLQTAFKAEKEACEHGDKKPLEEEMAALNKEQVQEINDGYSANPSGMQTLYAHELEEDAHGTHASLEQEMVAMNSQAPTPQDGYATAPSGMQTLFEEEQHDTELGQRRSLEDEIRVKGTAEGEPKYDDGYGTEPTGLQVGYQEEQQGSSQQLEQELGNLGTETTSNPDDGYSTAPIGMQTLYEREEAGSHDGQRLTLEQELHDRLQTRPQSDGYSADPRGMQTLFERELKGVESGSTKSLEEEVRAKLRTTPQDDGLSTDSIGMQTLFNAERQEYDVNRGETLEEELRRRSQPHTQNDGYSQLPIGLQTAFDKEQSDTSTGLRESLEKEIDARTREEPSFEDGYSTMPMGLQMMFRREKNDSEKGSRSSLEDDIKMRETASHYEDGYSCAPMGMQSSFDKENKTGSDSLEGDIKSMPGEGDISPTVGKFATSNKWYKQTARNNLSEDIQKAETKERNNALTRAMQDTYEDYHNPSFSGHWQLQPQNQNATDTTKRVDEKVHDYPAKHDQKPTKQKYEFKKDGLEEDLSRQALATSSSTATEISEQSSITASTIANTSPTSTGLPETKETNGAGASKYDIVWAEPAVYKIVAYDSSKDAISITTTPSNFVDGESPVSISHALSQLEQPARFIPHFAALQNEGFQVIHANRELLVLRKVDKNSRSTDSKLGGAINPVDGMSKRQPIEPPIVRFASPTGFVNHDPIFPPEPVTQAEDTTGTVYDIPTHGQPEIEEYHHSPSRVRVRLNENHSGRRGSRKHDGGIRKEKRGRWRRRVGWVLSVGAGTAVCTYALGVAGELAKPEKYVMRSK